MKYRIYLSILTVSTLFTVFVGCGGGNGNQSQSGEATLIKIDGLSTLFPVIEAVAEEFQKETQGKVRVTV